MDIEAKKELVKEIELAFNDVPKPDNVGIYLESLQGRSREDVKPIEFRPISDELASFTTEGFCYFLPAMLEAVILYPDETDVLTESIIRKLAPPTKSEKYVELLQQQFDSRTEYLNLEQKKAVKHFVMSYRELFPNNGWSYYIHDQITLNNAIEFWQQF